MFGSTDLGSQINPDVQRWFSMVDRDGSGRITATELQSVLANGQGGTFSDMACKLMIGKPTRSTCAQLLFTDDN